MSRNFICRCEDIDTDEIHEAVEQGFDDLESLRRYTAIGTGPCQGKACIQETIRLLADHHCVEEGQIGQMTLRPPFSPIPLGLLAALPPQALEGLLDETDGEQARKARESLESTDTPRTGRPTPDSVKRETARHRDRQGKKADPSPSTHESSGLEENP